MAKFQLWGRDEYGQGSIYANSDDVKQLLKEAEKLVNSGNVDNALTVDDKKRNWEVYMVYFEDKKGISYIYGGKDNHGKHMVYALGKKDIKTISLNEEQTVPQIFLGELDKENWYATDNRRKEIKTLDHPDLISKTVYFVRKVD